MMKPKRRHNCTLDEVVQLRKLVKLIISSAGTKGLAEGGPNLAATGYALQALNRTEDARSKSMSHASLNFPALTIFRLARSQFSHRNNLRRQGRAGILTWPNPFDPTYRACA